VANCAAREVGVPKYSAPELRATNYDDWNRGTTSGTWWRQVDRGSIVSIEFVFVCAVSLGAIFVAILSLPRILWCKFGWHHWYGQNGRVQTPATRHQTARLPGEVLSEHNGVVYRMERHCLKCKRRDYWNNITHGWMEMPDEGQS
jgi:hypothetical protein